MATLISVATAVALLSLGAMLGDDAQAQGERTCRFNLTVVNGLSGYESTFSQTRVDSYLTWSYQTSPANPNGAEFIQMLRVSDDKYPNALAAVPTVVPANPGSYWIIGNEPDRAQLQDSVTPETYAERFYNLATAIRAQDPTAKIGFGSIVQPTPIRLRYLDRAWDRLVQLAGNVYKASALIDFWSLHAFILCEDCGWGAGIPPGMTPLPGELLHVDQVCSTWPSANCFPDTHDNTMFEQFVRDFRAWMAAKGERQKPLWITEYGSLMPYWWVPESETVRYMTETFDFLLTATDPATGFSADGDRLVQRWFWYSLNHDPDDMGGNLYDPDKGGAISTVGSAWINYDYIMNTPTFPADPYPATVRAEYLGPGQWRFTVGVSNQGDATFPGGLDVAIYQGDPDAGGVLLDGSKRVPGPLRGCGEVALVTFVAGPTGATPWDIHVRITPDQGLTDADLTNNTRPFAVYPQSFADVPTTMWAWRWIESLYMSGITAGCDSSPLIYCPFTSVTRAQMAVFLLKGKYGEAYVPPGPDGSAPFSDIAGHWAEGWIEQLYDEGLTTGYPDGTYRPDNPVSRAEMAVLLLRAKHGPGYLPPQASGTLFTDVPVDHWAADWIEELAKEGITSGCSPGLYCPASPVTRAQMAVFLSRAFNLPVLP